MLWEGLRLQARFQFRAGAHDEALAANLECLAIAARLEDDLLVASTLLAIGHIHLFQNRDADGLPYVEQALARGRTLDLISGAAALLVELVD